MWTECFNCSTQVRDGEYPLILHGEEYYRCRKCFQGDCLQAAGIRNPSHLKEAMDYLRQAAPEIVRKLEDLD